MSKTLRSLIKLTAFTAVMAFFLVLIISAIQRPVAGHSDTFTATYTDANGLKSGDDVRMYGVQVGKVSRVSIHDGKADVRFTVSTSHPLYDSTKFAIRYQTLAGQRYVDVQPATTSTRRLPAGAHIGTDQTIPSLDITALFNGLQPVLAELSPASLNQFAENVLAFINGDGSGIGPVLDSISTLSSYVSDRQTIISALVRSFRSVADHLDGRSEYVRAHIEGLLRVFATFNEELPGAIDFALTAPKVLTPLDDLAAIFGLTPGENPAVDDLLRRAIPDPQAAVDILGRLPTVLQTLEQILPPATAASMNCSHGPAPVPAPLQILIAGQGVTICSG